MTPMAELELNGQSPPTPDAIRALGGDDVVEWESTESADPAAQPTDQSSPSSADAERIRLLEERFQTLERENATLKQRVSDTQAWGHQRNQEASLAQQLLEAGRAERERLQMEATQRAAMAPPSWSQEEIDAVGGILDPNILLRKMQETGVWGARQALNEVAPYVRNFSGVAQEVPVLRELLAPVIESVRERALADALVAVEKDTEIPSEEMPGVLDEVYRRLYQSAGPVGAVTASMNSRTLATAIDYVYRERTGNIAPVRGKAPKPRSLGSSAPANTSPKITMSREQAEVIRKAERDMGVKFSPDDIRRMVGGN